MKKTSTLLIEQKLVNKKRKKVIWERENLLPKLTDTYYKVEAIT